MRSFLRCDHGLPLFWVQRSGNILADGEEIRLTPLLLAPARLTEFCQRRLDRSRASSSNGTVPVSRIFQFPNCAARASNQALGTIGPAIQWQHSYVAGNKTFCVYLADGEDSIRKHAELSGIPISQITEVPQIIDPLTANN